MIHLYTQAYPDAWRTLQWPREDRGRRGSQSVEKGLRLHLVALPHTQTTADFSTCAYTQKVRKFCKMMMQRGHEVFLYGPEINDAPCTELVTLLSEKERDEWFGDRFDTVSHSGFTWDPDEPYWMKLNSRAIPAIADRSDRRDLILLTTGSQKMIADAFPYPKRICCEWTVGYEGIETGFCAFESSSFMHTVYALKKIEDGRDMDAVIPVMFDPDEFPHVNDGQGDYLLFVGRVTLRKGPAVALEIAKAAGLPLVVAGPGVVSNTNGELVGDHVTLKGHDMKYVGEIGVAERAELMAGARAVLMPTQYLEPFGGVAVEAQMCGTPAITTDWGAFRETVPEEWRFRSLQQALDGLEHARTANPMETRARAIERFSFDAVGPMYERWFDRLLTLWRAGWYELTTEARERIPT